MKALSFIGRGRYERVTYCWQGRKVTTCLFPEAVAEIFRLEKLIVLATPVASTYKPPKGEKCQSCGQILPEPKEDKTYIEVLQERFGDLIQPIEIPEGRSEQELWEIFNRVAAEVQAGETVLLDITHAFRSIPMIVFAVAAYLRRAKGVTIAHIVYGAFEARSEEGHVPVFDLTPVLDLLDWLGGVDVFLRLGDAEILAEKLTQVQRRAWRQGVGENLPERLQKVANCLGELSKALHLSRPLDVMHYANRLLPLLDEALEEIRHWSSPFAVVVQQLRKDVQSLAYRDPEDLNAENLRHQLELVRYYLCKKLIVQAVTLAREWLVSWVILQREDNDSWLAREQRKRAEEALSNAYRRLRGEQIEVPEWYDSLPKSQELTEIWSSLVELRNTLAHCAMSKESPGVNTIKSEAEKIPTWLQSLLEDTVNHVVYGRRVVINLKELYGEVAKLDELPDYLDKAQSLAGEGNDIVLAGQAPIWLYLTLAHALHGRARRLYYSSPVMGEILIFDHSAK